MNEQLYRRGRGGVQVRPFAGSARVRCRGYSQPLQRVLTDFGADESFGSAVGKVREHYGIEVPAGAVRQITEHHAEVIRKKQEVLRKMPERGGVRQVIGEVDGSLIPLVRVNEQSESDQRKTRQVSWCEARLALARRPESVTPRYGATLGSVDEAGDQLTDCVIRVGGGGRTQVHCVGDGAAWIVEQVERCFGTQGQYLIDFYHVSQYLAAASEQIVPRHAQRWRRQQQARLKENRRPQVLQALQPHLEAASVAESEAPVRACFRYLANRPEQFNYRGALQSGLPIGSGEIESAHRHVVQARLKIAGAWWKREHAASMLALRVRRANDEWQSYWQQCSQVVA